MVKLVKRLWGERMGKRVIGCRSDIVTILEKDNVKLSNKQMKEVVDSLYKHIEYSRMQALKQGKEYNKAVKGYGEY